MKCDLCDSVAEVFLVEIYDGEKHDFHFCDEHAREHDPRYDPARGAKKVAKSYRNLIDFVRQRSRLPKRLVLSEPEKGLVVKLGLRVGKGIGALLTVCAYRSFRRWVNLYDPPPPRTYPCKPL